MEHNPTHSQQEQNTREESIRVLHIDDDERFLELAKRKFKSVDIDVWVETLSDPRKALDILEEDEFDCVLCDYKMPEINGIELLQKVREGYPELPFIVLTSQGDENVASRAVAEDATDYIQKGSTGANYKLIVNRIENSISRKTAREEREKAFKRMDDAFYSLNTDWEFTYANKKSKELLCVEKDEDLVGQNIWEVFEWADGSKLKDKYEKAMETQKSVSFELYYPGPPSVWFETRAHPSKSGLSVYFRDITEQKERKRQLSNLIENIPGMAYRCQNERGWPMEFVSKGCEDLTGYDSEALESGELNWGEDILHPDDREYAWNTVQDSIKSGEPFQVTYRVITADGETRWMWEQGRGVYEEESADNSGSLVAIEGFITDVTGRKNLEEKLERSERRYRTLVENFPNGAVALVDKDLQYSTVGGDPLEIANSTAEEIEGTHVREAVPDELADELAPRYKAALEEGESDTFEKELSSGIYRFQITPVRNEDNEIFSTLGMSQDITESKEYERELQRKERRYKAATEAASIGTWEWDIQKDKLTAGSSFAKLSGINPDKIHQGVSLNRFTSSIHRDDIERVKRKIEEAVESGGEYEEEYRVWDANNELRWVRAEGHVECNEDGKSAVFPGAITDITDRKERERQLEEFNSILSHDLRNPLTTAQGYLDLALDSNQKEDIRNAKQTLQKIDDIIEDLQMITLASGVVDKEELNLENTFNEAYSLTDVDIDYSVEDMRLKAGRTGLVRLLTNLINNSVEHNDESISINAGPLKDDEGFYYEDDGGGIPKEKRGEIFEHGYTTSTTGHGLGLTIVRRIAEANGWRVEVAESESGGARFEVYNVN